MTERMLSTYYCAARVLSPSDELVTRTVARVALPPRDKPRRRRRVVVALGIATTLAITATALAANLGLVSLTSPKDLIDSNAARQTGLPSTLGAPEPTRLYCHAGSREVEAPVTGSDPRDACAALWQRGLMTGSAETPPTLQACVMQTGVITVYPGTNACAAIGRPVAEAYTATDQSAITLATTLMSWINATPRGCVTIAEGADHVAATLSQMHLADAGWRVATDQRAAHLADDGKQCVVPTVFAAKKVVLLG